MHRETKKYWESQIYVVEDDPGLALLIASALEDEGFTCATFSDGNSVIERLKNGQQALLLLDYSLPDMTGAMLVDTLREQDLLQPFIMVTGREDAGLAINMIKMGARDYLLKDLDFLDNLPATVIRSIQELETEARLKEAMDALRESEARLAKAQHLSRMGSWEFSSTTGLMTWSSAMFKIIGTHRNREERLTLDSLYRHIHPDDLPEFSDAVSSLLENHTSFTLDVRLLTESGEEVFVNAQGEVELAEDGQPLIVSGTVMDITDRKRAEQEIQQLAYYDPLTSLPNRTLLHDRLNQAISQAGRDNRSVAVMFIDLDRFKSINDSMGHSTGDRLLKIIADRLLKCVRESDTVSRIGGDEFVVIINAVSHLDYVAGVAEKIQSTLVKPVSIEGNDLYTTASIGIALFPLDGNDVTTLLKHADNAMYQAKGLGRSNHQFFSHEMNLKATEHLMLETTLRKGVERNEFFLVYQPQIDAKSGRIVGMEALVRWQHPELGLLMPGRFIAIAEETGIITQIGRWVLQTACRQTRNWQEEGLQDLRVAVNISARQFNEPDLLQQIAALLEETGLKPHYLELELTESTVMEHPEQSKKTLQVLKQMGISLAIDDFGTGYSSLSYLKHFPIDRLKIDQSFVCDITSNPEDAVIVDAIIAMAHSLHMKVTAEGVEKLEHLGYLTARNCDELQGYYLGTPVSQDEFTQLLREEVEKRKLLP